MRYDDGYFQGRKDLFEGLAIAELEKEWKQHPVLHFDMSACKDARSTEDIEKVLDMQLGKYEDIYGRREPFSQETKTLKEWLVA